MLKKIFRKFDTELDGELTITPYGDGHINDTYLVNGKYIMQGINTSIFKNPQRLMENIVMVTEHLKEKIIKKGGNPLNETLTVVRTRDGKIMEMGEDGRAYRVYVFIVSDSYNNTDSAELVYNEARAFGEFHKQLADFDASRLFEVIPDFHNTKKRFETFLSKVEEDKYNRRESVKEEIDFFISRREYTSRVVDILGTDEMPLRVTHNDTKLNNILFKKGTKQALSIIDLDTVMPGSVLYDFGDAIRTGASLAAEDERDLSKVGINMELFRAFSEGFLSESAESLTKTERKMLAFSAILLTFECGMRFLTDYLDGDNYFKTAREGHNLDRARTQIRMVMDMESRLDEMNAIVGV